MALIQIDHTPESIKMNTSLKLIIPDPEQMKDIPVRKRKILYLLHGLSDDASAWQRFSNIETYAKIYGLVVVMPSVGRSFYVNQPNGQNYFTYLMEELPRYLEDVFGIVPKRENTLIAGLSMGGYGAFKAAFLHPEKFFAAASFSGVLSIAILAAKANDPLLPEFIQIFGDLSRVPGSMHDPAVWVKKAVQEKKQLPRLFLSCGRQDDLYPLNIQFNQFCQSQGVEIDYHEEDGKHDWPFWDNQIQVFLARILKPVEQQE